VKPAPLSEPERLALIRSLVRDVPDFPRPGILFRDITTVLRDADAWRATIDALHAAVEDWKFDTVVGIESRGFILGSALAYSTDCGFVPVRKRGKLPGAVHAVEYELEYGIDALEIHQDALEVGHRVLLVDDLLATGGSASASAQLVSACGAQVVGSAFLVELLDLGGRASLAEATASAPVVTLLRY
jgi:adenine phosphoribosyltransferase